MEVDLLRYFVFRGRSLGKHIVLSENVLQLIPGYIDRQRQELEEQEQRQRTRQAHSVLDSGSPATRENV